MIDGTKIIIRADASPEMGSGHVMRCLAFAEGWIEAGGSVTFITRSNNEWLNQLVNETGCDLINLTVSHSVSDELGMIDNEHSEWVVLDGYHFDEAYQRQLRKMQKKILLVDDYGHLPSYNANYVLNQNISASKSLYPNVDPDTQFLLGPEYALIRKEFLRLADAKKIEHSAKKNVLITMGGADSNNVTLKALTAIQSLGDFNLNVKVVMGPLNPHFESIKKTASESSNIEIVTKTKKMSELMKWADIAISAGGSTCWELAYLGIPSLIVILAENQVKIANKLNDEGVFICLGRSETVNVSQVQEGLNKILKDDSLVTIMKSRATKLVDGRGVDRVVNILSN